MKVKILTGKHKGEIGVVIGLDYTHQDGVRVKHTDGTEKWYNGKEVPTLPDKSIPLDGTSQKR